MLHSFSSCFCFLQLSQHCFGAVIHCLGKTTCTLSEKSTINNDEIRKKLYSTAEMYVRAVESIRRIIIINKFFKFHSKHFSSDVYETENEIENGNENELKSILPNDRKKLNLMENKMKDLKLKIKDAMIHMYRPWELRADSYTSTQSINHNDDSSDSLALDFNNNIKTYIGSIDPREKKYNEDVNEDENVIAKNLNNKTSNEKINFNTESDPWSIIDMKE